MNQWKLLLGLVTLLCCFTCGLAIVNRTTAPGGRYTTALLYSSQDSSRFADPCSGEKNCGRMSVEDFRCATLKADAVIVSGHSLPPMYLNSTAERVSEMVGCLEARLVVLDTCYGFSMPLIEALSRNPRVQIVVGAITRLPPEGLRYEPGFFDSTMPELRSQRVQLRNGGALQRWHVLEGAVRDASKSVERWSPAQLVNSLQRKHPNLVRIPLQSADQTSVTALIPVEARRFRP